MKNKFKITVKLWDGNSFNYESKNLPILKQWEILLDNWYPLVAIKEFTVKALVEVL